MLVLSRKLNESVVVGSVDGLKCVLKVKVLEIRQGTVKLGFETEDDTPVHRSEVWDRITALEWGIDDPVRNFPQDMPIRKKLPRKCKLATRATTANRFTAQKNLRDNRLL